MTNVALLFFNSVETKAFLSFLRNIFRLNLHMLIYWRRSKVLFVTYQPAIYGFGLSNSVGAKSGIGVFSSGTECRLFPKNEIDGERSASAVPVTSPKRTV